MFAHRVCEFVRVVHLYVSVCKCLLKSKINQNDKPLPLLYSNFESQRRPSTYPSVLKYVHARSRNTTCTRRTYRTA